MQSFKNPLRSSITRSQQAHSRPSQASYIHIIKNQPTKTTTANPPQTIVPQQTLIEEDKADITEDEDSFHEQIVAQVALLNQDLLI